MRKILFCLLLLASTIACKQKNENSDTNWNIDITNYLKQVQTVPQADDSNSVVLDYDTSIQNMPEICKNGKPTDLSKIEIDQTDKLISDYLLKNDTNLIMTNAFKRQYIPATNDLGQKIVMVIFFCDEVSYWKEQPVLIYKGDLDNDCYSQIKVNLTDKYCYDLLIGGTIKNK